MSSVVHFRRRAGEKYQKHGWRKRAAHKTAKHIRFDETGAEDNTQTSRTLSKVKPELLEFVYFGTARPLLQTNGSYIVAKPFCKVFAFR